MAEPDQVQQKESQRVNIRRWILIFTFLLIPVTIFYISPIVIMMGASEGIVNGAFLLYIILFILSLFAGRIWCGWLCPMGACQELGSPLIKKTVTEGWPNWIKYGVAVLWIAAIARAFLAAGGIQGVDPFYGTVNGISISSVQVLMIVVMIFAAIFIIAFLTGKRGFCHIVCPIAVIMIIGRKIRNFAGWPALQLSADADLCTDCNTCSKKCPMGLDVHGMVREGKMENPECILCATCADVCPEGVIHHSIQGKK
ncbi:4Fe-4S binding protein [Methanocalculus taiwanensis]|uniref:4Fe-4S binding protein n=1 Tax=Methanocalculus taiwanensis TaxID=106207 RepID=A0ABD4TI39_9EURY|nr:4Fe-4S binding protein [Methanocalculus taiwanensis]MCQ1537490.1 4Fe-4S binding protein [Methanocalculus taiwanensis]